jgi:hypothetical protein
MAAPRRVHSTARAAASKACTCTLGSRAGVGGHVHGVEQMAGARIDPPVGKDTRPGHGREQPVAVAKNELTGKITNLREFTGFFHDVGHRVTGGRRPHADRIARLRKLLPQPVVVSIVDRRDEPAADRQLPKHRLENVAREFGFAAFRERHDGEIIGSRRHVGGADGLQPRGRRLPGRDRRCLGKQVEKPDRHQGGGIPGRKFECRLPAARRGADHPHAA